MKERISQRDILIRRERIESRLNDMKRSKKINVFVVIMRARFGKKGSKGAKSKLVKCMDTFSTFSMKFGPDKISKKKNRPGSQ